MKKRDINLQNLQIFENFLKFLEKFFAKFVNF